jgi:exonuclease VII large subunit
MAADSKTTTPKTGPKAAIRKMTDAQRDYEQKRAQKAGMTLDKWLDAKQRQAEAVQPKPVKPPRKPNLLSRLLERANKPLQKKP